MHSCYNLYLYFSCRACGLTIQEEQLVPSSSILLGPTAYLEGGDSPKKIQNFILFLLNASFLSNL